MKRFLFVTILNAGLIFGASAETYSWNSDVNKGFFGDAANWHAGSSAAKAAPGENDNIEAPLLYGTVALTDAGVVNQFQVKLEKKWFIFGKGGLTIKGDLRKSGRELIIKDGGLESANVDLTILGALVLEEGVIQFGLNGPHGELNHLSVQGLTTLHDGTLSIVSPAAILNGGLHIELGALHIYDTEAGSGGITVAGIQGGSDAVIRSTAKAEFTPAATLTIDLKQGQSTYAGRLENGGRGTLSVIKTGGGTQVLAGNENAYSGGTVVSEGILSVENNQGSATGSGSVQVQDSGVLAGHGAINGAVELRGRGTLSPGKDSNAAGTLSLNGGLVIASETAIVRLDVGGKTSDQIVGSGELRLDGKLVIAGSPTVRSTQLISGFKIQKDSHFASVETNGPIRFTRSGDVWSASVAGRRWDFNEVNGTLTVAL